MNTISRTITGSIIVTLGLVLIGIGFFAFVALFYGIPILIIGLFILFNKKEDEIETIKNQRFLRSQKSKRISGMIRTKSKGGSRK